MPYICTTPFYPTNTILTHHIVSSIRFVRAYFSLAVMQEFFFGKDDPYRQNETEQTVKIYIQRGLHIWHPHGHATIWISHNRDFVYLYFYNCLKNDYTIGLLPYTSQDESVNTAAYTYNACQFKMQRKTFYNPTRVFHYSAIVSKRVCRLYAK